MKNKLLPGNNTPKTAPHPFLKWAGGKGQLLNIFEKFYPDALLNGNIKNYYEPFVGGGAVFFDVASKFEIKSAFLFDINEELILTYKVVQNDVYPLIERLDTLSRKYEKLNETRRNEFFYEIRDIFNLARLGFNYKKYSSKWITRSAQIIFLNRTCFNGLFRFNSKGEFNVPAGRYKNPKILDKDNLTKTSQLLRIAEIRQIDFREIKKEIKPDSFVYFDPPYRPINKTSSFTAYSKKRFTDEDQTELASLFRELDKEKVYLMLSNSDPKNINPGDNFFDDLYKYYHISRIPAKRIINSDASKRNAINEIIVTNYNVKQ